MKEMTQESPVPQAPRPEDLPIYTHQQAILDAMHRHRAIVIEGPAGTGKTTQLPRILSKAGLIKTCMGITQPRRIAAVSVAARIAEEEGVRLGEEVGYAIRFDDLTSASTRIKVMTDGILLQEAHTDAELHQYDILMVDEAHERSLNIDFSLGLLHRLLQTRRDLKVIISSATLHPGHFQRYFGSVAGEVPVVQIEARMYPLEITYQPTQGHGGYAIAEEMSQHIVRLHRSKQPGHILGFLPGEGLIKNVEADIYAQHPGKDLVVLPLFGRLTREEQELIFQDFPGKRKVILSTNIAETSVTIPDVRFVVDAGLAKLPWYNPATGVTTLREEPISKASAVQRAGRAGRTAPGHVIRMYTVDDLNNWPEYTPEEIMRVDLSEAVLRLISLGVREVERFQFPTPPPPRKLTAAIDALFTLGAIDQQRHLTDVGRRMVPFPLSPSLARMVVEAGIHHVEAVSDVLLLAAYLSVRSPFLFPEGEEQQARRAHSAIARPEGDGVTAVFACQQWLKAKDKVQFCKRSYLDPDTMAFIHKAHAQLIDIAEGLGVPVSPTQGSPDQIVRCLATGFADKIMTRRGYGYQTAAGIEVVVHPSSALHNTQHRFVVAAEIMRAGRTYAFNVSAMKPEWIAEINPHAAQKWRVQGKSKAATRKEQEQAEKAATPSHIVLAGIELPVDTRDRRPMVRIPLETAHALQNTLAEQIDWNALPPHASQWRACVTNPDGNLLKGRLFSVLRMLPYVPLPKEGDALKTTVPFGALLELDRNLHTIERFIGDVLCPARVPRMKHVGWITLVANGSGGFWFEVISEFVEAVSLNLAALQQLEAANVLSEAVQPHVGVQIQRLIGILKAVQAAG